MPNTTVNHSLTESIQHSIFKGVRLKDEPKLPPSFRLIIDHLDNRDYDCPT
jgi:hypothetical protein